MDQHRRDRILTKLAAEEPGLLDRFRSMAGSALKKAKGLYAEYGPPMDRALAQQQTEIQSGMADKPGYVPATARLRFNTGLPLPPDQSKYLDQLRKANQPAMAGPRM